MDGRGEAPSCSHSWQEHRVVRVWLVGLLAWDDRGELPSWSQLYGHMGCRGVERNSVSGDNSHWFCIRNMKLVQKGVQLLYMRTCT